MNIDAFGRAAPEVDSQHAIRHFASVVIVKKWQGHISCFLSNSLYVYKALPVWLRSVVLACGPASHPKTEQLTSQSLARSQGYKGYKAAGLQRYRVTGLQM